MINITRIYLTPDSTIQQIQKAFATKGAFIYFSKGTYRITQTIYLYSDIKVYADNARFIQGAKIHNLFMTHTEPNTTKYKGAKNIEWYGGIIEGMGGTYKTNLNLLTLWHAKNCTIDGLTIRDSYGFHGIELNACSNILINNCVFEGYTSNTYFREMLQIDFSGVSAITVHPTSSKCYDLTPCKNITISNCVFKASGDRKSFYTAIGSHSQGLGTIHTNINIVNNHFTGRGDSNTPCIRFVGVNGGYVNGNKASGCGRFVSLYAYEYSYDKLGNKNVAKVTDGVCSDIMVFDNVVENASGDCKATGIYTKTKNNGKHSRISITRNTFKKGGMNKREEFYVWFENTNMNSVDCRDNVTGLKKKIVK